MARRLSLSTSPHFCKYRLLRKLIPSSAMCPALTQVSPSEKVLFSTYKGYSITCLPPKYTYRLPRRYCFPRIKAILHCFQLNCACACIRAKAALMSQSIHALSIKTNMQSAGSSSRVITQKQIHVVILHATAAQVTLRIIILV